MKKSIFLTFTVQFYEPKHLFPTNQPLTPLSKPKRPKIDLAGLQTLAMLNRKNEPIPVHTLPIEDVIDLQVPPGSLHHPELGVSVVSGDGAALASQVYSRPFSLLPGRLQLELVAHHALGRGCRQGGGYYAVAEPADD